MSKIKDKESKGKQWLGYYETSCGSHAVTYDTLEEVLKIKKANDQNMCSSATVGIYTKIPCRTMSITKPQAKQLYEFLHARIMELPNLLATLLDEIAYYYPDLKKEDI